MKAIVPTCSWLIASIIFQTKKFGKCWLAFDIKILNLANYYILFIYSRSRPRQITKGSFKLYLATSREKIARFSQGFKVSTDYDKFEHPAIFARQSLFEV